MAYAESMPSPSHAVLRFSGLAWLTALAACSATSSTQSPDGGGVDGASGDASADSSADAILDVSAERGSGEDGGACGVAFEWELTSDAGKTSAQCQAWLDQNCCTQQQACAADGVCKAAVECANRCAIPRADACVQACIGDASASLQSEIDAIGTCSKSVSGGEGCAWP